MTREISVSMKCTATILFVGALSLLCLAAYADESEEKLIFEAGRADLSGALANADECEAVSVEGVTYLNIAQETDPYEPRAYRIAFPSALLRGQDSAVLEIGFYDGGAGLIRPALRVGRHKIGIERQRSYTRLNTKQQRLAFFELVTKDIPDGEVELAIAGLQALRSIRILPAFSDARWDEVAARVPRKVAPMVTLQRPTDLVTTAGIRVMGTNPNPNDDIAAVRELAPLARVLGFNAIEMYVRWNVLEPEKEGVFDFSYYDSLVSVLQEYDLKWFPLLIVGSAYALPKWFIESNENVGFVCLEHGISNPIQSIWSPYQSRHVTRVLHAFGAHYEPTGTLLGVRLGPSGNYGESQYPAGGNWPIEGKSMHIHIGMWAGDAYGRANFIETMRSKYEDITKLNAAWDASLPNFEAIPIVLPATMVSRRQRIDFASWYTKSMSDWCGWWAEEAARAMPNTMIYQSAGGWGFLEAGTSYSDQTKAMVPIRGGIRLTNETDNFEQNICATRLAATAARLYGTKLGYEPASSHTARGIVSRLFNTATTNGDHFFTYSGNIFNSAMAIDKWLKYLPLMDVRQEPLVEVAVYYPETMNQLDDGAFRELYAWGFNPRAEAIRRAVEIDYLDDNLIKDGFLDRYKVLAFAWGNTIEKDVLERIDAWIQSGGVVLYPSFPRGPLATVEGDDTVFSKWEAGDTGKGRLSRFKGDMDPVSLYGEFVRRELRSIEGLHPWTKAVVDVDWPDYTFASVQKDGHILILNYENTPHTVEFPGGKRVDVEAYGISRCKL
ncbi:MAG: family 14 glycosylhydrolase [Candidatus Hydrogenedentes bacterium]|nr:family 14 glycosylhydrolase [Candidatus Hydrogenedentota bacterium]